MIIYGYRTVVRQLAMIMLVCSRCNMQTPHQLNKRIKKFTLFFIPLFPISIWHFTRCTACGKSHTIRKATAMQLLAGSRDGQPQPMQPQPYPQAQPVPQQPYQPAINHQPYPAPQYAPRNARPEFEGPQFAAPQFAAHQQPHYGQTAPVDARYGQPQGSGQSATWR